jgi:hypothetical protein
MGTTEYWPMGPKIRTDENFIFIPVISVIPTPSRLGVPDRPRELVAVEFLKGKGEAWIRSITYMSIHSQK